MKLEILNTSVVVLAKRHNPTILHPTFLVSEGIVPVDWETTEVICTPVFAIVKYKNGIVFNVEENRFQVTDNEVKESVKSSVAELALKYTMKLPYVHYTALGTNFSSFIEYTKPEQMLLSKFLNPASADFNGVSPNAVGLQFIYELPDVRLRLSCDAGNVKLSGEQKERRGIILNANYNIDFSHSGIREETQKQIKKAVELFPKYCDNFTKAAVSLFELGG